MASALSRFGIDVEARLRLLRCKYVGKPGRLDVQRLIVAAMVVEADVNVGVEKRGILIREWCRMRRQCEDGAVVVEIARDRLSR